MTTYRYTPLNEEKKEIRLITLFAGSFSDPIVISIHTVSFSPDEKLHFPSFEALSYAWGSASDTRTIDVIAHSLQTVPDTYGLKVTQNLALALPYLRHDRANRCLWIDAICINQEDIPERSSQIQMMGDIYSKAQVVLAWLGPEELSITRRAVTTLDSLASKVIVEWKTQNLKPISAGLEQWADRSAPLPFDQNEWDAIQALCLCSWFERLWIRQEVLLAKKAILIWGKSTLPWESFRKAIFCIYNKVRSPEPKIADIFWKRVELLDGLVTKEESQSLAYAIYSSRSSKCFDARDRIYAQLELINENRDELDVVADYSKTVLQVYEDLAVVYFEKFLDLGFLRYCDAGFREWPLPSWAPDWRCLDAAPPILPEFNAHANLPARLEFKGDALHAVGLSMGSIDKITEIDTDVNQLYNHAVLEFQRCAKLHLSSFMGANFTTQLNALSRVLNADDFGDRSDPPTSSITEAEAQTVIAKIWNCTAESYHPVDEKDMSAQLYLNKAQWYCSRRAMISTSDGNLGLAPRTTQKGDMIAILLGCPNPIVVRPVAERSNRFQVIGECYVDSIMRGAAFLGPLDDAVTQISKFNEEVAYECQAFVNKATSKSTFVDPRFEYWLGTGFDDRLDYKDCYDDEDRNVIRVIEVLKKRGLEMNCFELE
jgi:hypothetical protein